MNIKSKLAIAEQAIRSISTHDDADSAVVLAALDKITTIASEQADAVKAKQADAVRSEVQG